MQKWAASKGTPLGDIAMSRRLESLDLNLLNVLYWVLHERSTTAAADQLGLSQPATSRALGRLREVYDDPLLVKQGRAMVPTPLGEKLLPIVARAVQQMREVVSVTEGFQPEADESSFRVGAKDIVGMCIAEAWIKEIAPHAPGMTLDIVNLSEASARDLVTGKLDLVFMPLGPTIEIPPSVDLGQFVIRPVMEDHWVTCLRPGHPLAGKTLSVEEFAGLDRILINPNGGDRSFVDERLALQGLSRRIAYRTQTFLLAMPIVMNTDCVLTCCSSLGLQPEYGLVTSVPPVPIEPIILHAGWHPNWTGDARHRWVRERLMAGMKGLRSPSAMAA